MSLRYDSLSQLIERAMVEYPAGSGKAAFPTVDPNTGLPPSQNVQRTNAGFMASGQTAKQYVGKVATSTTVTTTVTLETVTTGKTFYITDVLITSDQNTLLDVRVQAAGTDIFRCACRDIAPIDMTGIETQPYAGSGQIVTILLPVTGSIQNIWFNVFGFEQ